MPSILVVEDDRRVLRGLTEGLQLAGYVVETAQDGEVGGRLALTHPFDCMILDWMLPGRDGISVLTQIRASGVKFPVLLLTARDAIDDRVLGLDSGADDYLMKPFSFAELLARIRVLLRRGQAASEVVLRAGEMELDLVKRRVTRRGEVIDLKPRELEVLEYLIRHKGEPVTREMLGRDVWKDPSYAMTNVVEVYINLLRRKIETPGTGPRIVTLRGVGYRLEEEK